MRDPGATQFRGTRLISDHRGETALCGSLNAKNGFGAYTGFQTFYAPVVCGPLGCASVPFLSNRVGFEVVEAYCAGRNPGG